MRLVPGVLAACFATGLVSCGASLRMAGLREGSDLLSESIEGTGEAASTVGRAYVGAAFRSPLNYVATGMAMAARRPTELVNGNLPVSLPVTDAAPHAPGSRGFEAWLTEQGLPEPCEGRLRSLVDGDEFFGALERETAGASEAIDIQTFIFDNDDFAVGYAEKLVARSENLRVRVMYDDLGTMLSSRVPPDTPMPTGFESPASIHGVLHGRGPQVRRTLNPWLTADHTKMFIFDRKRAYVGGMNIGREYRSEWHDLMVRVEGPVVNVLQADFDFRWRDCRFPGPIPGMRNELPRVELARDPRDGIRVLRTDVVKGRFEVLNVSLAAIRASKKRVWLQTPYFSSDSVERELLDACARGVDVRLVFPGKSDSDLMRMANAASALKLTQAGARVYIYPGMTHLKALLCDDWAMVGSANFDTLSMVINRELNLATAEPRFVRELTSRVFLADFRTSRRFRKEEADGLAPQIAETVADQL
ncbi:phosphatidylserine/phosphatidylglycerophosphate/cardiolipin synthase family protein [Haloferula helveola]